MILALIPSRLNSKRLKQKPLLKIDKLPMIIHTLKRTQLAKKIDRVIVCTDSIKIKKLVEMYDGESVLTSNVHKNGTERIAEVAIKFKNIELIVNVQGDEPLISPLEIDKVIEFHKKNKNFDIVVPVVKTKSFLENSLIKTVFDVNGKVIYFSRLPIPYNYTNKSKAIYFKDLSIVSFKPKSLKKFASLRSSKLEISEGIELLRAIENNMNIGTFEIKGSHFPVNVKNDFLKALEVMPKDKYRKLY